MDAFDPSEPYSRVYIYNERAPNLWTFNQHDFIVPSICTWRDPASPSLRYFAALGEDGHFALLTPTIQREEIGDSGIHRPSSAGYGYLNAVRQIGAHVYACGYSGQVYRRHGFNDWRHADQGLLQSPQTRDGAYFAQAIDGPHEDSIYVVGSENARGHPPRLDHWDGNRWSRLALPAGVGRLTNLLVESDQRIWLVGAKGTLLLGNAADGFRFVGPLGEKKLILSVALYRGVGYVGTNTGLFSFDPLAPAKGLHRVRTALSPELIDANVVHAVDDVLWSMGPKDLARFDGSNWVRINHPDNPHIGLKGS